MRYLGESDVTQMMGIGYLGEVRQGPDGNLYQYVQGIDGLGNPIGGFWSQLARRALSRAAVLARQYAQQQVQKYLQQYAPAATPFLKQAGVAGYEGLGELYQAPDGTLYQMQGLAHDQELHGLEEADLTSMMGVGYLGEIRQGSDGNLYQWVQGMDGLGNLTGFWSRFRKRLKTVLSQALPVVQQVASAIPHPYAQGVAKGLTVATPILQQAGVAGYAGLGALYQAPDGMLYQGILESEELRGLDDDAELRGLDADDELHGLDDDPELRGFDEDMELRGLEDDMELRGMDDSEDLRGFEADQDMQGIDGYVRQDGISGLERFEPEQPPQTRWYVAPNQPPEVWKPLW
jgi:hypothetical protein